MADKDGKITDDQQDKPLDYKNIHNVSLEEIFEEAAESEDEARLGAVDDKPKEEVKEKEPEVVTPQVVDAKPKEEEVKTPPLDEEKLTDSITNKLVEKLAPQDATKEEKKDLKAQIRDLEAKAKEEGRELTYSEALEFLAGETKEQVKAELKDELKQEVLKDLAKEVEDEEAKEKQQAEERTKYEATRQEAWNKQWDNELAELEAAGKIPKIVNPTDPNDPGRKERTALFETMQRVSNERSAKGLDPILSLVHIQSLYYKPVSEKPPGKDAPVNGARRSVQPSNPNDFSYQDIHNKDLESIMRGE